MKVEVRDDTMTQTARIEDVLRALPHVHEAVVLARDCKPAGRALVAYVVSDGPFDPKRLQLNLASVLPLDAMPIAYVPVSSLPLTPSGDVDTESLCRMAVVDSVVMKQWEERLRMVPGIDKVAVVVKEDNEPIPALHLSDLLSGWKSAPKREVDEPKATPVQAQTVREDGRSGTPAISHGGPLRLEAGAPTTLPGVLERAVRESPTLGVVYIQTDETEILQSYPALLEEAERILAGLRKLGLKPQDKVLFQLERNQDFIPAFWGCVLGGFVPVPISIAPTYASMNSAVSKLHNAWQMLDQPIILTDRMRAPDIHSLANLLNLDNCRIATIEELNRCKPDRIWHDSHPDDLAILLLTSGSTGRPKAVMQSHRSLLSQSTGTSHLNKFSRRDVSLNWMPLDHVGGIVMFHVRDVYLACQQIHVPTELILRNPLKWLDFIQHFRATLTWAPNFAFALINAKEEVIRERHWDLSSMRFILNGGEAIVARTARRFLRLLDSHGLPGTCMHPAWGMSETTSGVTYSDNFSLASTTDDDPFVEVGAPIPGFSMRIVDAHDDLVAEDVIGSLQVKGCSVLSGYYQNPELNSEVFTPDGWFNTGDLGVLRSGQLTITGREKDEIIVNGVNYHGHEIEAVVEEIPGVVVSYTAACAVHGAGSHTDKLAIFFHPSSTDDDHVSGLLKFIRENVVKKIGINPDYLVPVESKDIPKTAIGKIQRSQLGKRFEAGEFDSNLRRVDLLSGNANTLPAWFYRKIWRRKQLNLRSTQGAARPTLVFLDRTGLGASLRSELTRLNWRSIGVESGSAFGKLASDRYRIDPRDPEHYRRLLASVAADGIRVEQVLHLWTWDASVGAIDSSELLERAQDFGVYSLLFLAQALAQRQENAQPVDLQVISSNSQRVLQDDDIAYEKGSVLGFIKSVPQEMPWLSCRYLDLPVGDARENVARILAEIRAGSRDREVAYRDGKRWIPRLQRVDFQQQEKRALPFKRGGMYLLSGGLGGIGTEIAKYLLQQYEAKLLLVGRTHLDPVSAENLDGGLTPPSERTRTYRELEQLPGSVSYVAVDICDLPVLRQTVEQAKGRWHCDLDGVIHLAGIYQEKLLTEETRDTFAGVLNPKVSGTWNLSQLLRDGAGKTFILFSSLSGHFGGALNGAYSAANSFLDGFVCHQQREGIVKSHCLQWSTWDDLGVSRGYHLKQLTRSRGYSVISPFQGIQSFLVALHRDQSHILIGLDGSNRNIRQYTDTDSYRMQTVYAYFTAKTNETPLDRLRELVVEDRFGTRLGCEFQQLSELPQTDAGEIDREKLARLRQHPDRFPTEPVSPQSEMQMKIADFWREVLQIPQVGIHDNFFELGGNSLLATQISSRIQDVFNVPLSLRVMLEESTVEKLALVVQRHMKEERTKGTDAIEKVETVDAHLVLASLDQLSDEEVRSLLSTTLAQEEKR